MTAQPDLAGQGPPCVNPAALLQTRGLCRSFGALAVTRDVSFTLEAGARYALIGPNGAGKSTLINLLAGRLREDSGDICRAGERVNKLPGFERARRGLARTFQINALFADLTPLDAITLAVCQQRKQALSFLGVSASHAEAVDEAARLLEQIGLLPQALKTTRNLAYGHQRLLEIALALACKPKVLLLDEPAAGVPAAESRRLFDTLAQLPPELAILLIEHDMKLVFQFATRIFVLVEGVLIADGPPEDIARDPRVRASYLGDSHV
jgi:ABC-type branched-subunit amino acid transport system ATPase component